MKDDCSIIKTHDGSKTLLSQRFGQHYHSIHGAIQESEHVFMDQGLLSIESNRDIRILEMGLGTGLNALLAYYHRKDIPWKTEFISYEAFPIPLTISRELEYGTHLGTPELDAVLLDIHECRWNEPHWISSKFLLTKFHANLLHGISAQGVDLVIFDAFSPNSQPELWTKEVFMLIASCMNKGGVLSTYCSKGDVRRAMISAGFQVEKRPGPPGKREMLRAVK